MATGVELQIQMQMDNMAAWRKLSLAAISGRTLLWTMVDDAGDIPYENRVKGSDITAIDTVMDGLTTGSLLSRWFQLHATYFSTDVPALLSFETAMATWKWRASYHWAQLYYESTGVKLSTNLIYPRDDISLASYAKTSSTFTAGDVIDTTYTVGGKIAAEATSTIGAANLSLTATLTRIDDTSVSLIALLPSTSSLGTQIVYGEQSLGGDAADGQKTVLLSTTSPFKVGEPVLIEDDDNQEYAVVATINSGVSIVMVDNLRWEYTTANSAKVTPLFKGVTNVTHTLGTNGDTANIVPIGDREVSLA